MTQAAARQQIDFEETLRGYPFSTRRAFIRLDDEAKLKVIQMYVRHKRACDSFDMPVDPNFIVDACLECRSEQKLRRSATNNVNTAICR